MTKAILVPVVMQVMIGGFGAAGPMRDSGQMARGDVEFRVVVPRPSFRSSGSSGFGVTGSVKDSAGDLG